MITIGDYIAVVGPSAPNEVLLLLQFLGSAEFGTGNHIYLMGEQLLLVVINYPDFLFELSCF